MKALITYYSRTGFTKKVAESISNELKTNNINCDIEEIIDTKNRSGPIGYITGGKDALLKKHTKIKPIKNNPSEYDIVIIGSPNWGNTISPALRTYLIENKDKIKTIAFFCSQESKSQIGPLKEMSIVSEIVPKAEFFIQTKTITKDEYKDNVKEFVKKLKLEK